MKILLTNEPLQPTSVLYIIFNNLPPLNLAQLAAVINSDHEVKIVDNTKNKIRSHNLWNEINNFNPDIVGISNNYTTSTPSVLELSKQIKEKYPNITLVAGGIIPSYKPEYFLTSEFDYVVRNEGEYTFKELVELLSKNDLKLEDLKGISYKKNNELIHNKNREFIKCLDELPFPRRDLLGNYKALLTKGKATAIETTRGCSYPCFFCSVNNYWNYKYRTKSNKTILKELELIKKQGFKEIVFTDNSFGLDVEKTKELLKEIIKRNFNFTFQTQIRVDTVANNPHMIELAAKAGFKLVVIGFEYYPEEKGNTLNKNISYRLNKKASDILRKNNIIIMGTHMIAIPRETESDIKRIIKYGKKFSDLFSLGIYTPLIGSKLYDSLEKQDKLLSKDFNKYDYSNYLIKDNRNPIEIKERYIKIYKDYFYNKNLIFSAIYSKNKLKSKMIRRHYFAAILYIFFRFIKKIGVRSI